MINNDRKAFSMHMINLVLDCEKLVKGKKPLFGLVWL